MKKGKVFLASLFAGAFLCSTIPAIASEDKSYEEKNKIVLSVPGLPTYEDKIGMIENYLKEKNKCFSLNIANSELPEMSYGLHIVKLGYGELGYSNGVVIGVYKKDSFSILKPDMVLIDFKSNGYGAVDIVYKKVNHIASGTPTQSGISYDKFVPIKLTKKDLEKFDYVYREVIEEFYSENEREILEMKKEALEQKKHITDLFDIIDKK